MEEKKTYDIPEAKNNRASIKNDLKRATAVLLVYGSGAIIVTLLLPLEEFQHLSLFSFSFPAMVIMGIGALLWWLGLVKEYLRYKRKK